MDGEWSPTSTKQNAWGFNTAWVNLTHSCLKRESVIILTPSINKLSSLVYSLDFAKSIMSASGAGASEWSFVIDWGSLLDTIGAVGMQSPFFRAFKGYLVSSSIPWCPWKQWLFTFLRPLAPPGNPLQHFPTYHRWVPGPRGWSYYQPLWDVYLTLHLWATSLLYEISIVLGVDWTS